LFCPNETGIDTKTVAILKSKTREDVSRMNTGQKPAKNCQAITPELLQQIEELANSIHYGSINLIIQDGVLVSIEKSEKFRILKK